VGLRFIEIVSFSSPPPPSRFRQELCSTRQAHQPRARERRGGIDLVPERRRDAEHAHQRRVVLEVVTARAGSLARRLHRLGHLAEGSGGVLLAARVAAQAPSSSRTAEDAGRGTAGARSGGARPTGPAGRHLAHRPGVGPAAADLATGGVAGQRARPARTICIRPAGEPVVHPAAAARTGHPLGGGTGAARALEVDEAWIAVVRAAAAPALRVGERHRVPTEAAVDVRLVGKVDRHVGGGARRQPKADRQGSEELLGWRRAIVRGRVRIAQAGGVGRRAGEALVGAAVALPGPRVADGAGSDGHRAGAARALAVLETRAAGLRAPAAPRDAVVLAYAGRARCVGYAVAKLATLRPAAAAEREQVSR